MSLTKKTDPILPGKLRQSILYALGLPLVSTGLVGPSFVHAQAVEEIVVRDSLHESYLVEDSSIGKFTESLRDTPQSVTVISEGMLEDRGAMSLDDALRNVPGITLGAGEFSWQGNNPTIRGFSARNDMFIDGIRDLGSYTRDPFNLESVEVLQGPSSMVFGRGSTGGVINQSTKKPMEEELRSLHFNVGNADTGRVTADFNQPLNESAAFRINALYHDAEVPGRDTVETRRKGIAPSLSLGLGSATELTLSYMKLDSDSVPDYGLPWIGGEPAKVDRENYYGFADDYLETEADISTLNLDHRFNEVFSLNGVVRYADYSRRSRISEPQVDASVTQSAAPEDVTVYRMMFSGESDETMFQAQLNLRADFSTGGVEHTLVTGLELANETSDPVFGFAGVTPYFDYDLPTPNTNLANPGGVFTGTTARRLQADTESDTHSAYVLDTLKFNEQWQLMLGMRWDRFETDYIEHRYDANGVENDNAQYLTDDIETSYRAGLIYKPVPEGTIYLSWGTSFNPSSEAVSFVSSGRGLGTSNAFLDPEENENLELGVKWSMMEGRLALDSALFRITKDNARVADPDNPGFNMLGGEQEVEGISLNLTGRLTETLQVVTGFTHLNGEMRNPVTGTVGEIPNVADNTFSVWADWTPTSQLGFGAGYRYIDSRYAAAGKEVDSYGVFDAMARYQWDHNLSFKLNLTNVGDEYYIDQIHPWHVVPGPGFGAVFAVNLDY